MITMAAALIIIAVSLIGFKYIGLEAFKMPVHRDHSTQPSETSP